MKNTHNSNITVTTKGRNNTVSLFLTQYIFGKRWFIGWGILILIGLSYYFVLDNHQFIYSNYEDTKATFDKGDSNYLKIVILPFKANRNHKHYKSDYAGELFDNLSETLLKDSIPFKLLKLKSRKYIPESPQDAIKFRKEKNADIVIWGKYSERNDGTSKTLISYSIVDTLLIDNKRKFGSSENIVLPFGPSDITKGSLQNINYALYWLSGIAYYRYGDLKKASEAFQQIEIAEVSGENPDYFYNQLAKVFKDLGEYKIALQYNTSAIDITKEEFPPSPLKYADYLDLQALILKGLERPNEGLPLIEKAINLKSNNGSDFINLGYSIAVKGSLLNDMNQIQDANKCYQMALEYCEQASRDAPPKLLSELLGNLATYAFKEEDFDLAISLQHQALKKIEGKNVSPIWRGRLHDNLAQMYENNSQYDSAFHHLNESLSIQENFLPGDHPNLANLYSSIGAILFEMADYERAISFVDKAISISSHPENISHQQKKLPLYFHNKSQMLTGLKDFESAKVYELKSIESFRDVNGFDHPYLLEGLATIYYKLGKIDSSMIIRDRVLNSPIADTYIIVSTHLSLGDTWFNRKNYPKSMEHALLAMSKVDNHNSYHKDHRTRADIHLLLGRIKYKTEHWDESKNDLNEAKRIYGLIFSDEHPGIVKADEYLNKVNSELGYSAR